VEPARIAWGSAVALLDGKVSVPPG